MTEPSRLRFLPLALLALALLVPGASLHARDSDWRAAGDPAEAARHALAPLVPWTSPEGLKRLRRVQHSGDFQRLANQFEPQKNNILCGPTSAIIVMNALRGSGRNATVPEDPGTVPEAAYQYLPEALNPLYRRYTQDSFFNARTDTIKTLMQVYGQPMPETGLHDYGVQLRQLYRMLLAHGLAVELRVVDGDLSAPWILYELIGALNQPDRYILVNFSRHALDQPGGGHFSPLAAYDRVSHSFLVMDTVPLTSDWFWVSADRLLAAMRTFDTVENRGYLLISDPD